MQDEDLGGARVLWVVPGLVAEGRRVAASLAEARPRRLALSVSPEEADGLLALVRDGGEAEEGAGDDPYGVALSRFGAVGDPPPAYVEAARFALAEDLPLEGIDLGSDAYDEAFTAAVSTWQWWRYGRRMRRMEKRPPAAPTPEGFTVAWHERLRATGRGVAAVEDRREAAVADGLRRLAGSSGIAVLDLSLRRGVTAKR